MQSFVFAYGGKQLAEMMLGVQQNVGWDRDESIGANLSRIRRGLTRPSVFRSASSLALELFLGVKPKAPSIRNLDASLSSQARRLAALIRDHSHQFKLASKQFEQEIVKRQCVQARLADSAMWLHAWACTLSKLDCELRRGVHDAKFQSDYDAAIHFMRLAEQEILDCFRRHHTNSDASMIPAAKSAMVFCDTLPNSDYMIHEASPNAHGTGKPPARAGIRQFPGDNAQSAGERTSARVVSDNHADSHAG
jgi:hypothetical protein